MGTPRRGAWLRRGLPAGLDTVVLAPADRLAFNRTVLKRAYLAVGWRDADGNGSWTWHSLRHVFCTAALFTWKLDATDVSRRAGHANYRIALDMYVGSTAGVLDRARQATE